MARSSDGPVDELNLAELSELHSVRRMWMRGRHREDLCGRCRMVYPCPMRQLIDLVDRMGKVLEALTIPLWTGVGFPPTLNVTASAKAVLDDYRKAKGQVGD